MNENQFQERIIVKKASPLKGTIRIHGAKNAVLPIIAASILGKSEPSFIDDVPDLEDVRILCDAIRHLGGKVEYDSETLKIDTTSLHTTEPPKQLVQQMRASFLLMGSLLARTGHVKIYLPGGCAIGARPIDQHLKGFQALGAKIIITEEYVEAFVKERLQGAIIYLDTPSVGATENIMMAACLAKGTTILENAAQEPEIVDLANYLNSMGANIKGAGTNLIRIEGVEELYGTRHTVIPDRIETGTFLTVAAITQSELYLKGAMGNHLRAVISKLSEAGVHITEDDDGIFVSALQPLKPLQIKTLPYPGFPTDMQAQFVTMLAAASGTSYVSETVFENRYMHCTELQKMGANIIVDGRHATVIGGQPLQGAQVRMTDLRAGAAMIMAGLIAEGTTEITQLHHIDRGYVDIVGKLKNVGAEIHRMKPVESIPVQVLEQEEETITESITTRILRPTFV
ncbi:UDP-N-acetylglucosamine 1-carboxyvinyltransferase [Desulfuribacillus stibiiarsenatis]|uniref:UDP-N-acetylglucosamine 1-carboxyvinyltransferase n=1 Tax=Desulfuribacillus stibiiarsenatis TaxID=1390249 RepID=A0A1E5L5W1_9FIRM|nr:UDP-N-acetylglucosamine 1-carboxyvinyltransferase [Desulfuribacillus stibiiarsenatis]OEH85454.1 UDP-N-acetylglucosamine 1-carboxyvinyltransferase [Desulfuribacillus stibiiarsenatis]